MRWHDRGTAEQFRWFATLYAMALVFHYSDSQPLAVVPALLASLPALLFPSSVAAFALMVAAGATVAVLNLPAASNHLVMTLLVALSFGGAALWAAATRNRPADPGSFVERWWHAARGPAGLVLLVVYLFTVFDKLNTAFFDPSTSCTGTLADQLLGLNGFGGMQVGPGVVWYATLATVSTEAVILVLLAVPAVRCWGVLLGVCFHSVLALASFYDFATIVFAVYLLLVPTEVFAALAPRAAMLRRAALAGLAAHVLLSVWAYLADTTAGPFGLPWYSLLVAAWFVAVGPFMFALLRGYLSASAAGVASPRWNLRPAVLLIVPLLAFANGAAPYLGLKTVASYSMFSNLHTEEGRTNHLLPAITAVEVAGFARDTVEVTALYLPERPRLDAVHRALGGVTYLQRQSRWISEPPPVRIPWLELRRTVLLWQAAGIDGVRIGYLRDGVRHLVPDAIADPVLGAPLPWWQRHLLAFRAVDSGFGPDTCRW